MIEVKELVKRYKKADKNAVDGISLKIDDGKFFSLLGPNGAGKTTMLSILTTTLSKTSGSVLVSGYNIDKNPDKVRQNIGVIFQNPSLDLNLTAEENIRFHSVLYGLNSFRPSYSLMPSDYKKRVNDLSEMLGIEKDLFKPIKTFSGGMRRKLEIVRSLVHQPKILFLDEPTTGLDPLSRASLWKYLKEVRKDNGMTIFLTTHYLEEAEGADMVGVVNHGRMVALGSPEKIKKDLVDEFLVLDAKDKEELKEELNKMKLKYEEDGVIKVKISASKAQEVIGSIKTKLSVLKIHTPTLEEAYLEIINQQNK